MKKIQFKPQIWTGSNALDGLKSIKGHKVFLVTDPFMVKSGAIKQIEDKVNVNNDVKVFSDIQPDPPIDQIVKGIEQINDFGADLLIAVGGGSAIDATKGMKFFWQKTHDGKEIKLIAIPTTSGTGSEVTNFAVITDADKGVKYPLVTDDVLPSIALLDANLVKTAPQSITVDTGMDVLTHCLESYVSKGANAFSDAFAEKAFQIVFNNIRRVSANGDDMDARQKMHDASCIAGLAFNLAGLGINHSIAHAAGAKFHIPHGRLNTIIMPEVISYNAELNKGIMAKPNRAAKKYANLARLVGITAVNPNIAVRNLIKAIIKLRKDLKMPASFSEYGISKDTFDSEKEGIAKAAVQDADTVSNPIEAKAEDMLNIMNKSF
ncbi:1-propanol dehydrogenase PduQ [Limosilactobacillus avium]|uniref:1-propanol dehydrogenase PduQ n=1 Tax=Limosilactobacillus avium TaxID=2991831 RepID=UPI0024BAE4AB|nr:1-propanol dehydrogenase PduQ [Limosilactobacillus avium]